MDKGLDDAAYSTATRRALERFGIDAQDISLVCHSENVSFRVSTHGDETDYVLRLHRPGYNSLEELESERAWAAALRDAGVPVPESRPTPEGQHFCLVDIPGVDEQRYAGLTTWLKGAPLSRVLRENEVDRAHIFHSIGELAASVHNQAARWEEPPGFTRPRLDLDGLLGEAPRWGRFWKHMDLSATESELLLRARETARATLQDYGESGDNFSLVHADLDSGNIIYDGRDLALIDFDDAAYGWHMYDLASALINVWYAPDFDTLSTNLLDGYRKHRPLGNRDIEMLPVFLLVRGMVTIGWFRQRPEHDGSAQFEQLKNRTLAACEVWLRGAVKRAGKGAQATTNGIFPV